jgi:hypothetical protein
MSPTVFYHNGRRYFFFSREERRIHVHVVSEKGEAKFWLEPVIALADYIGYSKREIVDIERVINEHRKEIEKAWQRHFDR